MGQFGVYDLNTNCDFATAKEPVDIYMCNFNEQIGLPLDLSIVDSNRL